MELVEEAMKRMDRLKRDVGPALYVTQKALNYLIDLVQALKQQGGFGGLDTGLDALLTFLMDSGILLEFGITTIMILDAIIIFLSAVRRAIDLAQKFAKSELGQAIIKFLKENLFSKYRQYAITA